MAARKRRDPIADAAAAAAAAVAATQDQVFLDPADDEAAEVAEDVLEGLRRLDQGENKVIWYVYSQSPGKTGESEGYIDKLRSEQLDEARFKHLYGPGEYKIIGRTRDGGYVKGSHKVVRISDIGAAGIAPTESNDAVALLREMRADEERRAERKAENLKTTATIVAAPLATIMAALIARRPAVDMPALIAALRPQQNSLTEMTTALASLKQLDGGGSSHLDVVLKLLERIQDLPTAGGGDGGWLGVIRDVVREAAPTVREFVGQLGKQPGQLPAPTPAPAVVQQPPALAHTNGSTPPPAGAEPAQQSQANEMWTLLEPWLRRKAEDLHDEAASNMPVELSAEHLLTAAEKKFGAYIKPDELHALLSRHDWWLYLCNFYPPLAPFQAWVDDVRKEILGMLEESMRESAAPSPDEPDDKQPGEAP